ncbi:MAG: peptide chain release factor N(5)-glutamine methyltransferase [Propionibacteriales bacterium]|nr:peptide chain release factor N(5)-glutamine methyltransferase [Propionibacteriales bacterium]
MTHPVAEALVAGVDQLRHAAVPSARHDAEALLAHVLQTTRLRVYRSNPLNAAQQTSYQELLDRRAAREPLQHLLGSAAFRYRDLAVGPGVFVPRPETEVMAGVAIDELRQVIDSGVAHPRAVDLCTGSGAVAVAMATEALGSLVTGVELSAEAAAYAARNAAGHHVEIRIGDMADTDLADLRGQVSVVTANPPYIPLTAFESVDVEAREFDPPMALWSGDDGLDAIKVVAQVAAQLLVDGGLVTCEHADVQDESAPAVFASSGEWTEVRDHRDLAGRPRFVTARRARRSRRGANTSPGLAP